jgi:CheY-like chemotaxis protein
MPKTILVIEDEEDILKVVGFRLKKAGYRVISAGDGEEGLNLAVKEKPDLILLDFRLPKISGDEVCARIKSDSDLKHIPIIITTATHPAQAAEKFESLGAQDYILKPFDPQVLMSIIKKWILP